jgi:hypothetical protein
MPRAGAPEDDLQVTVGRGKVSARRSRALSVVVVVAALAAAAPGGPIGTDEAHLEVGGPARSAWLLSGDAGSVVHEEPTTSTPSTALSGSGWGSPPGADPPSTSMALALVMAEVLAPVQALSDSGLGVPIQSRREEPTSSTSGTAPAGPWAAPPPTFAPPSSTTSTTPTTSAPSKPSTTTKPPANTAPTTATTRPPTTTTTLPPTTTTTRPTTTTQPPPCTWAGHVQVARSGFVFDGQSNVLAPEWSMSFAKKLMYARFAGRPYQVPAVGGSTYAERSGWAAERTDPHVDMAPCAVLITHGGESELLHGFVARALADTIQGYISQRRATGFDVVVLPTIPPSTAFTAQQDAERRTFNDGLRRGYFRTMGADVLVDVAAIPELQDPNDRRYFQDGVHYTDAGASLVADAYSRALP